MVFKDNFFKHFCLVLLSLSLCFNSVFAGNNDKLISQISDGDTTVVIQLTEEQFQQLIKRNEINKLSEDIKILSGSITTQGTALREELLDKVGGVGSKVEDLQESQNTKLDELHKTLKSLVDRLGSLEEIQKRIEEKLEGNRLWRAARWCWGNRVKIKNGMAGVAIAGGTTFVVYKGHQTYRYFVPKNVSPEVSSSTNSDLSSVTDQ